jgi:hypothetical protein
MPRTWPSSETPITSVSPLSVEEGGHGLDDPGCDDLLGNFRVVAMRNGGLEFNLKAFTDFYQFVDARGRILGESRSDPGGLARRVEFDVNGKPALRYEVLIAGVGWQDRTPSLVWPTMSPEHSNAYPLTEEEATDLDRRWPTPHTRPGFRGRGPIPPKSDANEQGDPLSRT